MSKAEKENRINSLAVTFLERQQIIPNLFADQIISAYKEGYHQAEKDLHKSIYKAGFLDGFEDAVEGQYEKGYDQAEKDLELTWEDIEAIDQIFTDVFKDGFDVITNKYYQEVLKRFKDYKEQKV
jgi:hypothetical protein